MHLRRVIADSTVLPERPWQFRVQTGERPPTVNRLKRWRSRGPDGVGQAGAALDEWKDATSAGLMDAGLYRLRLVRARIEITGVYNRGPMPDGDGLYEIAKAVQDRCVDHEIIPEDNPWHADSPRCHVNVVNRAAPWPLVVAEIVPLEPLAGHDGDCGCRAGWEARSGAVRRA